MLQGAYYHLARPFRLSALKIWGRIISQKYDMGNTICIFSSGRGGSTWVSEVLSSPKGSIVQYEPFHPLGNPTSQRFGFSHSRPYFTDARPPTALQIRFIKGLFDGSYLNFETATNHQRPAPTVSDFVDFQRFVVKFIQGNLALPWISRRFPVRSILLLRHPCAVVASQMRFSAAWGNARRENLEVPAEALEDFPEFRGVFNSIRTPEEALAFMWALDTILPLRMVPAPYPWTVVFYEDLAVEPAARFLSLFSALGLQAPPDLDGIVYRPSTSVREGISGVLGWRDHLKPDQIKRVMNIVGLLGADFYDETGFPVFPSKLFPAYTPFYEGLSTLR